MHRRMKHQNEFGYSLFESIFQLLIMAVFLHFFVLFFHWKAPIERQIKDYYETEWELFGIDLQALLKEAEEFNVLMGGQSISFITERGKIEVGRSSTVIRKKVGNEGRGHISMFTNVSSASFNQYGHELYLEVEMLDGRKREKWFAIGRSPE